MSERPKDLKPRTKAFALRVIRMYSKLPKNDAVAQVLGKQVLRSGTSVGANYREARRLP
jgi:four helix bundle protein